MIDLFDVNVYCGGTKLGDIDPVDPQELADECQRVNINNSLIRIGPKDLDSDWKFSLKKLYGICETYPNFVPCPLVLPNTANDFISEEEQVANAIAHNAAAVCIRPIQNGWLTDPWCSGDLMKALEERRMPVLAADGQVSIGDVVTLAENYPQLPIILADNNYRDQRIIAPLMKQFKNVYLSTGLRYNSHMGLEHLAETCSIERILFGSGWPQTEASASITYITYADLSDDEKAMIGSGNIKRLIEAIVK